MVAVPGGCREGSVDEDEMRWDVEIIRILRQGEYLDIFKFDPYSHSWLQQTTALPG